LLTLENSRERVADAGTFEKVLARGTTGMSGADLANICNIAAINASNNSKDKV